MIKRLIEHREYQQLRKDQMNDKKFKQAGIVVLFGVALLLIGGVLEQVTPEPKPVKAPHVAKVLPQTALDAERFAELITMPVDQLQPDDLEFIDTKAGNPCYEEFTQLPAEDMVNAIKACEVVR